MKFSPSIELKTLADCEDGEMIRFSDYGTHTQFAIVGALNNNSKRLFVYFEKGNVFFEWQGQLDRTAVAFGKNYTVSVDPTGPYEGNPRKMFEANGVLYRAAESWLLAGTTRTAIPGRRAYSFATASLTSAVDVHDPVFGKWQLIIGDHQTPIEDRIVVFSKEWTELSKR